MKRIGWLVMALAVAIVLVAFSLDTSTVGYAASAGGDGAAIPVRTVSPALLQRQMMMFELGLAALIAGVLLHVGGEIAGRGGAGGVAEPARHVDSSAAGAAPANRPRRPASRGELLAGGAIVAAILLILLFVAFSGKGNDAAVNDAGALEMLNEGDEALVEPEPHAASERANRQADRERNEAAAAAAAPAAPPDDAAAANSAAPPVRAEPPASNAATAADPASNGQ